MTVEAGFHLGIWSWGEGCRLTNENLEAILITIERPRAEKSQTLGVQGFFSWEGGASRQ